MENPNPIRKRIKLFAAFAVIALVFSSGGFIVGTNMAYLVGYNEGAHVGYNGALADVASLLQQKGITLDWTVNDDGSYILTVTTLNGQTAHAIVAANLLLEWRDKNGNLVTERGTGYITDYGKDWIEQELSGTHNTTQHLLYLGDSDDATDPSSHPEWTTLPSEITSNGLERATGTYYSAGTGEWIVNATKTASDTQSTQLWGLYASAYAGGTEHVNSLIAADSTPAEKNMVALDTLTETWTITIT